jgi:hypothetical protein
MAPWNGDASFPKAVTLLTIAGSMHGDHSPEKLKEWNHQKNIRLRHAREHVQRKLKNGQSQNSLMIKQEIN